MVPSTIDEVLPPGPYVEAVPALALAKARAVIAAGVGGIVLAADTVVVIDGEALGKPADSDDARAILRRLRGRAHDVITGVAVVDVEARRELIAAAVTRVVMASYPDAALEGYVASGSPLDKAGAYAIQDIPPGWISEVRGSYSNVVGLPLPLTRRLLGEAGVAVALPPPGVSAEAE